MKNSIILVAASCAVLTAVACGSSSSNNTNTDAGGSSGSGSSGSASSGSADDGGGSSGSSSGGDDAAAPMCMSAADCSGSGSGAVCCLTGINMSGGGFPSPTTSCATGMCPAVFGMTIQLCASNTECTMAGQTCMASPLGMGMFCSGPQMMPMFDGGFPVRDSGSPSEGGSGDAAPQDGATGG